MKIFNEKEAQEICIVDIDPTKYGTKINYKLLTDIASECFMPLSYGGGINSLESIRKILFCGYEKVILNTSLLSNMDLLRNASMEFGASTIIGCIDFYETLEGCFVKNLKTNIVDYAKKLEDYGAGELLINNISRDGTKLGLNTKIIEEISMNVNIPIIASGGVSNKNDLVYGLKAGANAVAASSLFVYKGNLDAVLINYPDREIINKIRNEDDRV